MHSIGMKQTTEFRLGSFVMVSLLGGCVALAIVVALNRNGASDFGEPLSLPSIAASSRASATAPATTAALVPPRARDGSVTVAAMVATERGPLLGTAGNDGIVRVSTAEGRDLLAVDAHHGLPVTSIAFSRDGRTLLSAGRDSEIGYWDVETGTERFRLRGHEHAVKVVSFSPSESTIASAGEETRIMVWDAASGRLTKILSGHSDFVNDVSFSGNGDKLVSAGADGKVLLWDLERGAVERTFVSSEPVAKVAFGGETLAGGLRDGSVVLWDVASGRERQRLSAHGAEIAAVALRADGRMLATASADNQVVLWDADSGELLRSFGGPDGGVTFLSFDAAGKLLVGGSNGSVAQWDSARATGRQMIIEN